MAEDNVTKFPDPPKPPDLLIGPFSEYRVVVEGRLMPLLTGFREGDKIWLVVDGRFACGPFSEEQAHQAALLAGQAMAVTAGYPHLGAASKEQPFAPQCSELAVERS
jgi:hypothetical protein